MTRKNSLLVVEDDRITMKLIQAALESYAFHVVAAHTGEEARSHLADRDIRAAILDINLPDTNGLELLKEIRKHPVHQDIPVMMLTVDSDKMDTVLALEMGADDYITKPFHKREMIARLNALLRRIRPSERVSSQPLVLGELEICPSRREVTLSGTPIHLTFKEFELLLLLARHPGRVFTRDELLDRLWSELYISETRAVDIHVSALRKKLGAESRQDQFVETVHGVGYRFRQ